MSVPDITSPSRIAKLFDKTRKLKERRKDEKKLKLALRNFRPRKSERGSVVFIGLDGKRGAEKKGRRGFAIYVNTKGRKDAVRQRDVRTGTIEKVSRPRLARNVDPNRIKSKRAKKKYLQAIFRQQQHGIVDDVGLRIGRRRLNKDSSDASGYFTSTDYSPHSRAVSTMVSVLAKEIDAQRSRKNFQVTVMFLVRTPSGEYFTATTTQRISKPDKYKVDPLHLEHFFTRQVYAFLARELEAKGLVTRGSANHVRKLNKGTPREEWMKDGQPWQGAESEICEVERIEYRIDFVDFKSGT